MGMTEGSLLENDTTPLIASFPCVGDVVQLKKARLFGKKYAALFAGGEEYRVDSFISCGKYRRKQVCYQGGERRSVIDQVYALTLKKQFENKSAEYELMPELLENDCGVRLRLCNPLLTMGVLNHGSTKEGWFDYSPFIQEDYDLLLRPIVFDVPFWLFVALIQ